MTKTKLIDAIKKLMKNISNLEIINIDRYIEIRNITQYVTKLQAQTKSELIRMYEDLRICLQIA